MIAGGPRCPSCGRAMRRNKGGELPSHTRQPGRMVAHVGHCPGRMIDWRIALSIEQWFGPAWPHERRRAAAPAHRCDAAHGTCACDDDPDDPQGAIRTRGYGRLTPAGSGTRPVGARAIARACVLHH